MLILKHIFCSKSITFCHFFGFYTFILHNQKAVLLCTIHIPLFFLLFISAFFDKKHFARQLFLYK